MYQIGTPTSDWNLSEDGKTLSAHGFDWKVERTRDFNVNGKKRKVFHVKKPRGKKYFAIFLYENGVISTATPY